MYMKGLQDYETPTEIESYFFLKRGKAFMSSLPHKELGQLHKKSKAFS